MTESAAILPGGGGRRRPLRILFVVRPGTLLRFTLLIPELAARGHELHFAFGRRPERRIQRFLERVAAQFPLITYEIAPCREEDDGWRSVAAAVRGVGDLARYAHPRYGAAPVLRNRAAQEMQALLESDVLEPITRRLVGWTARRVASTTNLRRSDRLVRAARELERAIPPSRRIDSYIRQRAPDAVLAASITRFASDEIEFLKSARRAGIPTGICVASWDKLTNKGLLKFVPDRVFVWNEMQAREAQKYHAIPADRVRVTGASSFDEWFERRPSVPAGELSSALGLDPKRPYVLYLCSSPYTTGPREVEFVTQWIDALRSSGDERVRSIGIAVRPHPNAVGDWRGVDLGRFGNAAVCASRHHWSEPARAEFFDVLAHSSAVVGVNTTAMIEAAILGKSVLTVLHGQFAQESTLHFHYLLAENGGFLHVADSMTEHVDQLARALEDDADGAARRRQFVEAFVRPCGLDHRAAPILADAIEELEAAQVDQDERQGLALGPALALAARLNARYHRSHPARSADPGAEATSGRVRAGKRVGVA